MSHLAKADIKILIVDDIKSARKVLQKLLESIGYSNVVSCETVVDSLTKLKTENFSLIISDLNLKDGSGMELFQTIRATEKSKSLPFILMTSDRSSSKLTGKEAYELTGFLLKPFSAEDLENKVKAALEDCIE